ncbi:MAG: Maf family protein [Desulfovibrio sp.]|nr:Maf family protein [Desulfovibrio sp.]
MNGIFPVFTLRRGFRLVLASTSPRRKQFLEEWGVPFLTHGIDAPEPCPFNGETPAAYARRAAVAKAQAVARFLLPDIAKLSDTLVLGADTVVTVDGEILGKPRNDEHALSMLQRLNGRCHEVISAVCLLIPSTAQGSIPPAATVIDSTAYALQEETFEYCHQLSFIDTSRVCFSLWPLDVLEAYVRTGEPADKAGAYAIQGQGAFLLEHIEGSWCTVVGLPVMLLARLLLHFGLMKPVLR